MAKFDNYASVICKLDSAALYKQWSDHVDGKLAQEVEDFWKSGKLLEYTILRAFQIEGADVRWPYSVYLEGDEVEQIDGSISFDGYHILSECKDYDVNVNIEPFAKLRNQLIRRPASTIGCIFVKKGFTEPAIALARFCAPQTILLWEGDEILYSLEHKKMIECFKIKMGKASQEFLYHYNTKAIFTLQSL